MLSFVYGDWLNLIIGIRLHLLFVHSEHLDVEHLRISLSAMIYDIFTVLKEERRGKRYSCKTRGLSLIG